MQENKLTPTEIAAKSEVLSKYMGWWKDGDFYRDTNSTLITYFGLDSFSNWHIIHKVWEKVRGEKIFSYKKGVPYGRIKSNVMIELINGTPEQCFIALVDAVEFINNLKQENNA